MCSKINTEGLKQLFLFHSENSANDYVRAGRIGPDEHAMLIETLKASRMDWDKAKAYLDNRTALGFLDAEEKEICLSVCAEYCPSSRD